jgi:predicted  nucleic acid-binding Zn-ribbon protein
LHNTPGDLDDLKARIEAVEASVETLCRPLADLFSQERVHAIERAGYDAQLRIDALEAKINTLEQKSAALHTAIEALQTRITELQGSISEVQATASEAVRISNTVTNSRTWQVLVKASSFLVRSRGGSGQSGQ